MPRQSLATVENSFIKGLVTRATGLNFPEQACTDADNCVFDEVGRVTRRLGIDYENDFQTNSVNRANGRVINNFVWKVASDFQNVNILVVQVGDILYFYNTMDSVSVSNGLLVDTIDLQTFRVNGATTANVYQSNCQFDAGFGTLFVFHPFLQPIYITLDLAGDDVTATSFAVEIRDFEGVNDSLDVEDEPVHLSNRHEYNLQNQGWGGRGVQPGKRFYNRWKNFFNVYPANNNKWWLWKNSDDVFQPSTGLAGTGDRKDFALGNTYTSKGYYIYNAFNMNRNVKAQLTNLPTTSSGVHRASVGAFFAGRTWFSGINHPDYEGRIFFSQIIETKDQFGRCYQVNDPTSEVQFDLLPSDGGVIIIADAARIIKLVPVGPVLMVFAENGIWTISGSEGVGFKANDYSINKLAGIPVLTPDSFVNVAGFPMWWNNDGIYTVKSEQVGGFSLQSITETSIREFYQAIPAEFKRTAKGAYNDISKTVQWVFRDVTTATASENFNFNRVLTLNLQAGSFSPWTVSADPISINGIFFIQNFGALNDIDFVVDSTDETVIDSALETVVVPIVVEGSTFDASKFGYLVSDGADNPANLTIGLEKNDNFTDWVLANNQSTYESNFTTGYKLHGKGLTKFQAHYINLYVDDLAPGQFHIRNVWDYAVDANTGRWSTRSTIVNEGLGKYSYKKKRIRLRGHGIALQFQVISIGQNAFSIVGWTTYESANSAP